MAAEGSSHLQLETDLVGIIDVCRVQEQSTMIEDHFVFLEVYPSRPTSDIVNSLYSYSSSQVSIEILKHQRCL